MPTLKKGTAVRVVQRVIEGEVMHAHTNGEEFGYMVSFKDEAGEEHHRFFHADQIEEIPAV